MEAEVFPGILLAPIPVSPISVRRNYTVCWALHTRNGLNCWCWCAVTVHHCSARAAGDPIPSCGTTEPNYKSRSVSRCVFNTQHLSLREGKVNDSKHQPHTRSQPQQSAAAPQLPEHYLLGAFQATLAAHHADPVTSISRKHRERALLIQFSIALCS